MKVRTFGLLMALLGLLVMMVPAASAQEGQLLTHIRVAHFSPDTPTVRVYLNGEPSGIQLLSYGDVSGWVELPAGTYSIAVAPFGGTIEDAAIGPANFRLAPGAWITVAATGSLGAGTLGASIIDEDYTPISAGEARLTVFHGIEDAPAVDVILPDGTAIVSSLSFGESATLTVPATTYDLAVVAAGTTSPAVLNLSGVTLQSQTFYMVSAVNSLAAPRVNLQAIPQSVVAPLFGKVLVSRNIAEVAAADGRFTTLLTALSLTGLDEAITGPGPFTVFAPTDAAFRALPAGVLDSLIADPDALADVLLYHVVSGRALAADVVQLDRVNTLNGIVRINVTEEGRVFLNDNVEVIITDIPASNGVIHVINAVLVP
jgi:uncharacterized surface protein with fasciclin (FAS1) repeats